MTLIVISYDIIDDTRRNKVAKVLLDYGERVQYSVFEVAVPDKLPEIKERISLLINRKVDNIRYYPLCRGCDAKKTVIGRKKESIISDNEHIVI